MQYRINIQGRYAALIAAAGMLSTSIWFTSCSQKVEKPAEILVAEKSLPEKVDYNLHIKPILSDRCFACHGPDKNKQKAGLRLDIADQAYDKLESGNRAIVPGDLADSELFHRIVSTDPEYMMPTPESHLSLNIEEKALLIRWIEQGAEYKPHWSLVAPTLPELPTIKNTQWVRNDIDRFVAKKHEEKRLSPAPEADKTTLLRRVSLDLTGLPPTAAEVDAFLADNSPNAYEKAVDRLLASPHFGERQAVDWLDVARYADTHGYQDDGMRTVWPYRDWVIKAYNQNLPFDKFVTWQLAGDMLPKPNRPDVARDMLVATAFNRNHQQSQEGGIVPEEYQAEYIADRTNTFGKAFLGLTMECARCHDHKYDPISTKDYYALGAFFAQNNEYGQIPYNGEPAPHLTLPTPEVEAKLRFIREKIKAIDKITAADVAGPAKQRFTSWLANARRDPARAILPPKQDLLAYIPFDQIEDKPVEDKKKEEEKKKEAEKKGGKQESNKGTVKLVAQLPVVPPQKPQAVSTPSPAPKIRRLFKNVANDTLPLETRGDLDYPIPHVAGRLGKGVKLVGESRLEFKGRVEWSNIKSVPVGWFERNQPFTVSIWVNVQDPKLKGPLFNRNVGPFNGFRGYECVRLEDGRLGFRFSNVWPDDAIDIETEEPLPLNRWMHITMAYDGSSHASGMHIYVNGEPAGIRVVTDNLTQSTLWGKKRTNWGAGTPNFSIGHRHDYTFKGFSVDELRIYARKLTDLEVNSLFAHPEKGAEATLLAALRESDPTPEQQAALFDYFLTNVDRPAQERRLTREQYLGEETRLLDDQIDVMVMRERRFNRPTHILKRGAYDAPGDPVEADTPDEFFKMPDDDEDFPRNRLGLAKWLVHPENPLFSRVIVNRIWQQYFGQGLVKTSDDFGNQGNLPSHPELLDYLAVTFREKGWNLKALHKLIVMSATYRQSSSVTAPVREKDFDNTYLSRGPSYRLSAEQVRDNALAASGLLTRRIGGPSVYPYQPAGIWEALATRNAVNYLQSHGDTLYRRSLYTIWKRSSPPPMMLNFDAAERHTCTVRRQKTSTPLQALVTMNDPQFVEAARVLAQRALSVGLRADALTNYVFKSVISRPARPQETALMQQLYAEELADFRKNPTNTKSLLSVGEFPVDPKLPTAELAAWTVVASTVLNFDEAIIKR